MKKRGSSLHHVALNVTDIEDKVNLFKNVFGMKITLLDGDPEHPKQVWFDGGIQLISCPDCHECSLAHVALTSGELECDTVGLETFGASQLPRGNNWFRFRDHLVIELMQEEENE